MSVFWGFIDLIWTYKYILVRQDDLGKGRSCVCHTVQIPNLQLLPNQNYASVSGMSLG